VSIIVRFTVLLSYGIVTFLLSRATDGEPPVPSD